MSNTPKFAFGLGHWLIVMAIIESEWNSVIVSSEY